MSVCCPRFMAFMQWNIITAQGKTASSGTKSAIASQCWLNARAVAAAATATPTTQRRPLSQRPDKTNRRRLEWSSDRRLRHPPAQHHEREQPADHVGGSQVRNGLSAGGKVQISEFPTGDFGSNRQAVSVETDRPFRSKAAPRLGGVSAPALANRCCGIDPILPRSG